MFVTKINNDTRDVNLSGKCPDTPGCQHRICSYYSSINDGFVYTCSGIKYNPEILLALAEYLKNDFKNPSGTGHV